MVPTQKPKVFILIFLILLAFSSSLFSHHIPVFTYEKHLFRGFTTVDKVDKEICQEKRILVYGPRAYQEIKAVNCPGQLRIVGGILYISLVYDPRDVYVSPLPHPLTLKRYYANYVVVYSQATAFYFKDLEKHLNVKGVYVDSVFKLESEMPRILELNQPILLLPDPVLFDERAHNIIKFWIKRYKNVRIVDLANIVSKISNSSPDATIIPHRTSKQRYLEHLRALFLWSELERGKIYYVED